MSVSTSNRTCNKTLLEIWQKKENNELEKRNRAFLINQDENGIARVYVGFESEDVRLNVEQMMELFDASQQDISYHINQIYAENEHFSNCKYSESNLILP